MKNFKILLKNETGFALHATIHGKVKSCDGIIFIVDKEDKIIFVSAAVNILKKENSQVYFFVSGAGSEIRPAFTNKMSLFSKSAHGFALVSIYNDTMKVSFMDDAGNNLYSVHKVKK